MSPSSDGSHGGKFARSMALPEGYLTVLERLGRVFGAYHQHTGDRAVLVGGAATVIYTAGTFLSADFDIVASASDAFDVALIAEGFRREERTGHLMVGFYHPDHPEYGFQQVSGQLFDGRSDRDRLVILPTSGGGAITLPSIEDLIADRLGRHAIASKTDDSRLQQAVWLFRLADQIDRDYLLKRIMEEGGDPDLLPLGAAGS
jgi:hypothetical protein